MEKAEGQLKRSLKDEGGGGEARRTVVGAHLASVAVLFGRVREHVDLGAHGLGEHDGEVTESSETDDAD